MHNVVGMQILGQTHKYLTVRGREEGLRGLVGVGTWACVIISMKYRQLGDRLHMSWITCAGIPSRDEDEEEEEEEEEKGHGRGWPHVPPS
jgi:hypothetical protein